MTETRLSARIHTIIRCVCVRARAVDSRCWNYRYYLHSYSSVSFGSHFFFFACTKLQKLRTCVMSDVCMSSRAIIKANAVLVLMIDVPLGPKWMIYVNLLPNVWFDGWQATRQTEQSHGIELVHGLTCGCNGIMSCGGKETIMSTMRRINKTD